MFRRPLSIINKKLLYAQYKSEINIFNLLTISRFRINKIFKNEKKEYREIFLHNLISDWIDAHDNQDLLFFSRLKKIIKKTNIILNDIEIHNLNLLDERAFSLERHLKSIDVNEKLKKREMARVKFIKTHLYEIKNPGLTKIFEGNLLITNKAIIILSDKKEIKYFWKDIKKYSYRSYGFRFKVQDNDLVIRCHDQITLNNTLKNHVNKHFKTFVKTKEEE